MELLTPGQAAAKGHKEVFITYPALGSQLLLLYAAQIRHRTTGARSLVGTTVPELFSAAGDFCDVLDGVSALTIGARFPALAAAGLSVLPLTYYQPAKTADNKLRAELSHRHLLADLCAGMGLSGRVLLDPVFPLLPEEQAFGRFFADSQIAIMSEGKERRKTWGADRMQAVVDALGRRYSFVQIGAPTDAPLSGVLDKRGALPLRQVAAVLHNSDLFLGGIGALMHLARGVRCPAVITYSRSEPLEVASYPCNTNLQAPGTCTRCQTDLLLLEKEGCPEDFACVRALGIDTVITAVEEALARRVEVAMLDPNPARPLNAVTARVFSLAQKQMVTVGV